MKYLMSMMLMTFGCIGLAVSVFVGSVVAIRFGAAVGWGVGAVIFGYAAFLFNDLLDELR